jgi:hypothetical protein
MQRFKGSFTAGVAALALVGGLGLTTNASADVQLFVNANNTATISGTTGNVTSISVPGATTSGIEQLSPGSVQYYYRVGTTGAPTAFNLSVDPTTLVSIPNLFAQVGGTTSTPVGGLFNVATTYTLTPSNLDTAMTLTPTTGTHLANLAIYQVVKLNLNNGSSPTTDNSATSSVSANNLYQDNATNTSFTETNSGTLPLAPSGTAPGSFPSGIVPPALYQVDSAADLANILNGTVNNGNLNDTNSYTGANAELAMEWIFPLSDSGDATIPASFDFNMQFAPFAPVPPPATNVPEPATTAMSLLGLAALLGCLMVRRRDLSLCRA